MAKNTQEYIIIARTYDAYARFFQDEAEEWCYEEVDDPREATKLSTFGTALSYKASMDCERQYAVVEYSNALYQWERKQPTESDEFLALVAEDKGASANELFNN